MKRVLFLIHDLGQGGAEKVLVNLVNNMDPEQFDISVIALFGGGVNEQFLKPHIKYSIIFPKSFPGNSRLMKLFTPAQLHKLFIREQFDIEVSYLEGPSARIISGCPDRNTKLVSWIHVEQHSMSTLSKSFRDRSETEACYKRFDRIICVSKYVMNGFCSLLSNLNQVSVLYNTIESEFICNSSKERETSLAADGCMRLVAVGTLKASKGYRRLLCIIKQLKDEAYPVHLYIMGDGPLRGEIEQYIYQNGLVNNVTLLGYQVNPYKYVSRCDLFVCASFSEGFSTAATEALIVGTPVCTVEVSGMKELLGENNEFGVVTENSKEGLYKGIKCLLDNPDLLDYYRRQAGIRGKSFSTQNTVKAVEEMLLGLDR